MKARTNVTIDRALLEAARSQGLSLSHIVEQAVRDRLAQLEAERWLLDNRKRIALKSRRDGKSQRGRLPGGRGQGQISHRRTDPLVDASDIGQRTAIPTD